MSYILNALKKQEQESTRSSVDHVVRNNSYQPPSSSMLLWGVLLTFAIFLALLAGFWMGQQTTTSSEVSKSSVPAIAKPTTLVSTKQSLDLQPSNETSLLDTQSSAVSNESIPSEQFFQQPPMPKEKTIVKEAKPLILGANTDKVTSEGELLNNGQPNSTQQLNEAVPASLLAKFNAAVAETSDELSPDNKTLETTDIIDITELPLSTQNAITAFSFDMHIYQSNHQGWVRVNNQDYYEGQQLDNGVVIETILPQLVIMRFNNYQFSMAALSAWQ